MQQNGSLVRERERTILIQSGQNAFGSALIAPPAEEAARAERGKQELILRVARPCTILRRVGIQRLTVAPPMPQGNCSKARHTSR